MSYHAVPYPQTTERVGLLGPEEGEETPSPGKAKRSSTRGACYPSGERDKLTFQICATRTGPPLGQILSSREAAALFVSFLGRGGLDLQEHFLVMLVSARNDALGIVQVSIGSLAEAPVAVRDALRPALVYPAAGIILCHNHPSGDPTPSRADLELTERLAKGATLVGLRVLDHIIVTATDGRYSSLLDAGLMPRT